MTASMQSEGTCSSLDKIQSPLLIVDFSISVPTKLSAHLCPVNPISDTLFCECIPLTRASIPLGDKITISPFLTTPEKIVPVTIKPIPVSYTHLTLPTKA